ncbi:hypothetical protein B7L68_01320 [Thermoproteus sp. CP80]|nr:hypothetical protein B7L68_01320 [Thermoproteus sp. CP80]
MRPVEDGRASPLEGWGPEARHLPQVPAGSAAFETPLPRRPLRDAHGSCGGLDGEGRMLALLKLHYWPS